MRRSSVIALAPVAAAALCVGLLAPVSPAAAAAQPSVVLGQRVLATGLQQPVHVTSANDGSSRMFVVEKAGRIRVYTGNKIQSATYLDLRSKVAGGGERGMLGVAFSPRFPTTHQFWVTYTRKNDGYLVVSRFTAVNAKATTVAASTEKVVFVVPRPDPSSFNHNGGSLAFGKDGYLYIGTGDGGGAGDPYNRAQSPTTLNGKILRLDVARGCKPRLYCIPSTNPYAGSTTLQKPVYARGFRNPWRISIDASTGYLWVGDVGQDSYEEIDVVRSTTAGRNYGWSCQEGDAPYNPGRCDGDALIPPVLSICHPDTVVGCTEDVGGESVTGGFVYRGSKYAATMSGRYFFGDFITGNLWVLGAGVLQRAGSLASVTSFGVDDGGEPYAVTIGGSLIMLTPRAV